ncbi:MAG TPA: alpha/beta fold hydrolase [Luteimonas sp.]|nr:alpha/beta fold hydrolase [Luteimonas sp.]
MNALKQWALLLALALTAAFPFLARAQDARDPVAVATALLDAMDAHDYAAAEAAFTAQMAATVPADRLKAVWESLPAQAGVATGRGEPEVARMGDTTVVSIPLHHAGAELVAKVAVDAQGQVAGFVVQPATAPAPAAPAADAGFSEQELTIGDGASALPATLALPTGDGPFPAVVLVHGSGPHDRNETIGPNRPFLDIARGLAAQGVAVLRYAKRSKAHPEAYVAPGSLTIDSETTDDAVAALATLAAQPQVDPNRVFVFGHSQGGMMAPRIASRSIDAGVPVAGLVLLAAPSRKLMDILIEQNQRMAVLDDRHTSDEERAAINRLIDQMRAIRAGDEQPAVGLPLNLPAAYWRSTDTVDPVHEAQFANLPMLVLQGARDIQVVDADWQGWKAGFHDDAKVEFKLYPALNHLGIAGEGDGNLGEYSVPGHVDAGLIADVATWIGAH